MDAKSLLGVDQPKEAGLKLNSLTDIDVKKVKKPKTELAKRPDGMNRELYKLLSATEGSSQQMHTMQAIMPTHGKKSFRNPKVQIGLKKVHPYRLVEFVNEARTDGLKLKHWQRIDKMDKQPYLFAKFNKVINIPSFSDEDYEQHLKCRGWTKEETLYLFEKCRQFDLRWPIIEDRYDSQKFSVQRSMEDLKERFYSIVNELQLLKDPSTEVIGYDADHERRRKEQAAKLWSRTHEEVEEEEELISDLKRLEARKRERERKAHDLQKLISMAEMQPPSPVSSVSGGAGAFGNKKSALPKKNTSSSASLCAAFNPEVSVSQLRFSEFRSAGTHLRSQEMKLPTNIGQKKLKNIEVVIDRLKLEMNPIGSEDIVAAYNDFRSDIVLLQELKSTLQTAEYDLESLKTRYQQQTGKAFEIDSRFRISILNEGGLPPALLEVPGAPSSNRKITSYLELSSKAEALPSRKRKVASTLTPSPSVSDLKRIRKN